MVGNSGALTRAWSGWSTPMVLRQEIVTSARPSYGAPASLVAVVPERISARLDQRSASSQARTHSFSVSSRWCRRRRCSRESNCCFWRSNSTPWVAVAMRSSSQGRPARPGGAWLATVLCALVRGVALENVSAFVVHAEAAAVVGRDARRRHHRELAFGQHRDDAPGPFEGVVH